MASPRSSRQSLIQKKGHWQISLLKLSTDNVRYNDLVCGGKFEMFIMGFAVLIIIGYRSLWSKRRAHAVHAVCVAHVTLRQEISFVILLT